MNTSEIPMRFAWRVPEDAGENKEFQVVPQKGTILPSGKQKIGVEFVSQTVQRYNHSLLMDIPLVRSWGGMHGWGGVCMAAVVLI